jgi:hypothetical protein
MKEIGNSLVQFIAIILIMITFAVSSAAVSLWAGDGADAPAVTPVQDQQMVASAVR